MSLVSLDDNDPSIEYQGNWELLTGNSRDFDSTEHIVSQVGATATFKFTGSSVSVICTLPSGTGTSAANILIDSQSPVFVSKDLNSDSASHNIALFVSETLPNGGHTIVITNAGTGPFSLDRFRYNPESFGLILTLATVTTSTSDDQTIPAPVIPQTTTTGTTVNLTYLATASSVSSPEVTAISSNFNSSTTTVTNTLPVKTTVGSVQTFFTQSNPSSPTRLSGANSSNGPHSNHSVSAIIAIVFGIVFALLVLSICLIFWIRKRRINKAQGQLKVSADKCAPQPVLTPYELQPSEFSLVAPSGLHKTGFGFSRLLDEDSNSIGENSHASLVGFSPARNHSTFHPSPVQSLSALPILNSPGTNSTEGDTRRQRLSGDTLIAGIMPPRRSSDLLSSPFADAEIPVYRPPSYHSTVQKSEL
jgi:hypothetical protein